MAKLLYIVASPRGTESKSAALAASFIEARKAADPSLEIDTLDLFKEEIPDFDGDKAAAKMTFFGVGEMDATRQSAWDKIVEVTNRFSSADEYVFAVPMWNGGIPYKLKQYIDVITQPGLTFGFDPERGYFGLLENKKATAFVTSGVFAPSADPKYGTDYHSTYLEWWLNTVGVQNIDMVRFQPSLLNADPEGAFTAALEQANQLAK